jgi:hypothetical protein
MAGTVTKIEDRRNGLSKIKVTWSSDTAGAATSTTDYSYNGQVWQVVTIPDGGATAPTAAYDITIKDSDGVDLANALLADRSATATEAKFKSDGLLSVQGSTITLAVSNAGDTKGGVVIIHLIPLE